jgi:predicted site-specific integrase-resolvase
MKAKDVMKKFDISRNTLSNWVKMGYIKVEKTLSGRYIYLIEENKDKNGNTGTG